jgi:hypothetical protein
MKTNLFRKNHSSSKWGMRMMHLALLLLPLLGRGLGGGSFSFFTIQLAFLVFDAAHGKTVRTTEIVAEHPGSEVEGPVPCAITAIHRGTPIEDVVPAFEELHTTIEAIPGGHYAKTESITPTISMIQP